MSETFAGVQQISFIPTALADVAFARKIRKQLLQLIGFGSSSYFGGKTTGGR